MSHQKGCCAFLFPTSFQSDLLWQHSVFAVVSGAVSGKRVGSNESHRTFDSLYSRTALSTLCTLDSLCSRAALSILYTRTALSTLCTLGCLSSRTILSTLCTLDSMHARLSVESLYYRFCVSHTALLHCTLDSLHHRPAYKTHRQCDTVVVRRCSTVGR